ncbi:MAG: ACP phosphodiesterase [Planctomycetota bacterium]
MNFLAHLVLADECPKVGRPPGATDSNTGPADHPAAFAPLPLVGSLFPDLAREVPAYRGRRGETHPDLPVSIRHGIARHRRIDRITDTHPAFLRTRSRLTSAYGRFAGVVADVLFDHALSLRWDQAAPTEPCFPPIPRTDFIAAAHIALQTESARVVMPPAMRRTIDAMIEHRWLARYATPLGLERTFLELAYRFTRRYGRPIDLTGITSHLAQHSPALLADFDELWNTLLIRIAAEP